MIENRRKPAVAGRGTVPPCGWLCVGLLLFASGCAMCANPYDSHYAAYGGAWQRGHPSAGRVGSVFQPTGDMVMHPAEPMGSDESEYWGDPEEWDGDDPSLPEPMEADPPDWTTMFGP